MSHNIRKVNFRNSALLDSTIIDYVQGGEPYTLAELGIVGPIALTVLLAPSSWSGEFNNTVKPRLVGANVILENGPGLELPSTVGLNYTFVAIVHGA